MKPSAGESSTTCPAPANPCRDPAHADGEAKKRARSRLLRFDLRRGKARAARGKGSAGVLQTGFEQTPYLECLLERLTD